MSDSSAGEDNHLKTTAGLVAGFRVVGDALQANVFVASPDLTLLYANTAAIETLRGFDADLVAAFGVSADEVMGGSIHRFHKNPARVERILADWAALPHDAEFRFGPVTLHSRINVIRDPEATVLGYVVVWEDVSERLRLQARSTEADELQRHVDEMLAIVGALADGDLTVSVDATAVDGPYADMAIGLASMLDDLRARIKAIGESAATVATSSEEISNTSAQMLEQARITSREASHVSRSTAAVAGGVSTVSHRVTEMQATMDEVSQSASEAARVAASGVQVASITSVTVEDLRESSQKINKIIKMIGGIARQTNLLALNATIEAARAGVAGRGFAVVANEVKELARETGQATAGIDELVTTIQDDATKAAIAVSQIASIINRISDLQSTIATAVEQQAETIREIAQSASEAGDGSQMIATSIGNVAAAAEHASQGASETQDAARELTDLASQLQLLVEGFRY